MSIEIQERQSMKQQTLLCIQESGVSTYEVPGAGHTVFTYVGELFKWKPVMC